jgi:hypothetical protein
MQAGNILYRLGAAAMSKELNVLALVKGEEQYIFLFDDSNRTETLRMLGRYAANPELSFTWFDAAVLSEKIRDAFPADGSKPVQPPTYIGGSRPQSTARFSLPLRDEHAQ